MSGDIWERVALSLHDQLHYALFEIRQQPHFEAMGSEIERAFAAHLVLGSYIHGSIVLQVGMPTKTGPGYFLAPQVSIGAYRVDFVLARTKYFDNPRKWIVIECDGHDFHERTKEQAARDKARDRFLSAEVARVLRFTGSEIYRDVGSCWADATKVMSAVYGDE